MRTIHKYQSPIMDNIVHEMPRFAQPLHAAMQGAALTIWAVVETDEKLVNHYFTCRGMGHDLTSNERKATHLSTVMNGPFVWHVFSLGDKEGS